MSLKLVTVFGASGFIGRHLIRRLAKTGAVIRVPTRDPVSSKLLRPMGDVGQIVPMRVDLRDAASVAAAVDGADSVVNLVGILAEWGGQRFVPLQAEAPGLMARAAAVSETARFVQVSAIGADTASAALYARTKAAGEEAARAAMPQTVVLRPSIVFGPEDQFFNRFAAMAQLAPVIPLVGAETHFQPVYVGDVADAIMAALTNSATAGKTYELGGPRVYTLRQLIELMLVTIGRERKIIDLPAEPALLLATLLERLPGTPLTRDQVKLLQHDNVVADGTLTLADLGIEPSSVEAVIPTYLDRFRTGGRFSNTRRLA